MRTPPAPPADRPASLEIIRVYAVLDGVHGGIQPFPRRQVVVADCRSRAGVVVIGDGPVPVRSATGQSRPGWLRISGPNPVHLEFLDDGGSVLVFLIFHLFQLQAIQAGDEPLLRTSVFPPGFAPLLPRRI